MKRFISLLTAVILTLSLMVPVMTASAADEEPIKKRVTYYTEEKVKNARENIEKYDWAKEAVAPVIAKADKYVAQGYDFIWYSLASQGLPRSYGVNQKDGCLNCGKEIDAYGNYPYIYDPIENPWKVTCPSCKYEFPTNDFESFYYSALDEDGNFDVSRGDKQYLKNIKYPDKGENWGVDDGWGYVHTDGKKYTFIAHYNHEANYHYTLREAIDAAYQAYIYTGEQKYADWVIVHLDRIAAMYPDMTTSNQKVADGFLHSDGSSGLGKIMGRIWETSIIRSYLFAYDAVFDAYDTMSEEAIAFLNKVSHGKRDTYKKLMVHVEQGLFMEIFPGVRDMLIHGNQGMHQYTLTAAAVILDDKTLSKQWLDFVFAPSSGARGNLDAVFVNSVDRDGYGNESAPGYNRLWINNFMGIANLLNGYKVGGDGASYDLFENVKFKKMLYAFVDLIISDKFTPSIGDTGQTGYTPIQVTLSNLVTAYLTYDDPYLAQAIYLVNGNTTEGLSVGIYDGDAEKLAEKIENVIKEKGAIRIDSVNLTGYGYACVKGFAEAEITESNKNISPETATFIYYGRNSGHGHKDTLNLGLFAFDVDLMPDLGYPEFADSRDMHRRYFVINTISHNTVMVNDSNPGAQVVGNPVLFDDSDLVKVISVSADLYSNVNEYKRTTATIKYGDGLYYLVDFFSVNGGNKHTYILHGAESSAVTADGIELIQQDGGTLLSPYGVYGTPNEDPGYQWFTNVRKTDSVTGDFTVDWSIVDTYGYATADDIHLKVHMLGEVDKVALADGVPPTNKPGNPEKLTYMFADRINEDGSQLESMFNSVIEPYSKTPFIVSACQVPVYEKGTDTPVKGEEVKAVKVELEGGRTDIVVYCSKNNGKVYNIDGIFDFSGSFVVYSVFGDETVVYTNDAYVTEGTKEDRRLTGVVEDFTRELTDENYITVSFLGSEVDPASLAGKYIYINRYSSATYNACYEIISAEKLENGNYSLFIGDVTPIETKSLTSQTKSGYTYSIVKKQNFYIPLSKTVGDPEKLYDTSLSGSGDNTGDISEGENGGAVVIGVVICALAAVIAGGTAVTAAKKKKGK